MGRRPTALTCGQKDRAELERLSRGRTEPMQRIQRAQIILTCLGGEPQAQIAARLGIRPNTVSKWRIRFAERGIDGLADAPRSGKPKTYRDLRTRLLALLEEPPPKGQAAWDGLALAKAVGAKKSTVYALLKKMASGSNATAAGVSAPIRSSPPGPPTRNYGDTGICCAP